MINLRPAESADLEVLARIWYERAILTPKPRGMMLLPDARDRWQAAVREWIDAPDYIVIVAQAEGAVVGFTAGRLTDGPIGFMPERTGEVLGLALDGHAYYGGVGRALAQGLFDWFRQHAAAHVFVHVPHAGPVEQAFWRAMHGEVWSDVLWMIL